MQSKYPSKQKKKSIKNYFLLLSNIKQKEKNSMIILIELDDKSKKFLKFEIYNFTRMRFHQKNFHFMDFRNRKIEFQLTKFYFLCFIKSNFRERKMKKKSSIRLHQNVLP